MEELKLCWDSWFNNESWSDDIRDQALKGNLVNVPLRSICWQVFLGTIPCDKNQWEEVVKARREKYEELRKNYLINPITDTPEECNLSVNNPLSQQEDSPWQRYFLDAEVKKQIILDIERTFPEEAFFQHKRTQRLMLNILFIYAKQHPTLGYRQGMHELLAPLLWIRTEPRVDLKLEETSTVDKTYSLMLLALDSSFVEHDAAALFDAVMATTGSWFECNKEPIKRSTRSTSLDAPFQTANNTAPDSVIVHKVSRIQHDLLRIVDRDLHSHLSKMEIAPQVYGLRWMRLLFGREMELSQLLVLWDCLFADSIKLDLVDYTAVALLTNIRMPLLQGDCTECLMLLMRYPGVNDVIELVQNAMVIRDKCNATTNRSSPKHPFSIEEAVNSTHQLIRGSQLSTMANTIKTVMSNTILENPRSKEILQPGSVEQANGVVQTHKESSYDTMCRCASLLDDHITVLETELHRWTARDETAHLVYSAMEGIKLVANMLRQQGAAPPPSSFIGSLSYTSINRPQPFCDRPTLPTINTASKSLGSALISGVNCQEPITSGRLIAMAANPNLATRDVMDDDVTDASNTATSHDATYSAIKAIPLSSCNLPINTSFNKKLNPDSPINSIRDNLQSISLDNTVANNWKLATRATVKRNFFEDDEEDGADTALFGNRTTHLLSTLLE